MSLPHVALISASLSVGSYLAFGRLVAGVVLLSWTVLHIVSHLFGGPK